MKSVAKVSLRHRVEYWLVVGLGVIIRSLPRDTALVLGGRLGILAGMLLKSRYRLAEDNLRRAFPGWSRRKVRVTAWANFRHIGICAAEMLRFAKFRGDISGLVKDYDLAGREYLDEALALGRGVILLTGHQGFWEAGNFIFSANGYDFAVVAKPMKNPLTGAYIDELRKGVGGGLINSRKGARRILQALQQGKVVGILLDQHIKKGAVVTDFFGRPAYTTTAITNLAMKYRIPVVPAFCLRQSDGRYTAEAEPMILLEGTGSEAVAANTQLLTDKIEAAVRRAPDQWFWMHKRWRVPEARANEVQGTRPKIKG